MANFSLLELGQNDELTTVIKKSNMNFRNLGWALKQKIQQASDGSSGWKQAIADLRDETEQEVSTLTKTINTLSDQLTAAEMTMERMVPPIGSVILQTKAIDPNTMYPGTTWTKWSTKHPVGIGESSDGKYYIPKDSDGKSMSWATIEQATASDAGAINLFVAWYRVR